MAINALGWLIPAFIIFASKYYLSTQYKEGNIPP